MSGLESRISPNRQIKQLRKHANDSCVVWGKMECVSLKLELRTKDNRSTNPSDSIDYGDNSDPRRLADWPTAVHPCKITLIHTALIKQLWW